MKIFSRDPDNCCGNSVEDNWPPNNVFLAMKLVLPDVPGDYRNQAGGPAYFTLGEGAALD